MKGSLSGRSRTAASASPYAAVLVSATTMSSATCPTSILPAGAALQRTESMPVPSSGNLPRPEPA